MKSLSMPSRVPVRQPATGRNGDANPWNEDRSAPAPKKPASAPTRGHKPPPDGAGSDRPSERPEAAKGDDDLMSQEAT